MLIIQVKCKNVMEGFTIGRDYQAILSSPSEKLSIVSDYNESKLFPKLVWNHIFEMVTK